MLCFLAILCCVSLVNWKSTNKNAFCSSPINGLVPAVYLNSLQRQAISDNSDVTQLQSIKVTVLLADLGVILPDLTAVLADLATILPDLNSCTH